MNLKEIKRVKNRDDLCAHLANKDVCTVPDDKIGITIACLKNVIWINGQEMVMPVCSAILAEDIDITVMKTCGGFVARRLRPSHGF